MRDLPRRTATLLFTAIEGSARLLHYLGERYAGLLEACRQVLSTAFQEFHGYEVGAQSDAHRAWIERERRELLRLVAEELHGFSSPWHCGGGWALDVYLGRVTRIHHDLDVALSRADQLALHQCSTARSRGVRTSCGWPRMPPQVNRKEREWRYLKRETRNHLAATPREFVDALLTSVRELGATSCTIVTRCPSSSSTAIASLPCGAQLVVAQPQGPSQASALASQEELTRRYFLVSYLRKLGSYEFGNLRDQFG